MKFTGINLLLILFAPLAVIFVISLLLYPLQNKLFDREKPLKNRLKNKRKEFKEEVRQNIDGFKNTIVRTGKVPTSDQVEEIRREIKELHKEFRRVSWDTTKEIIKVHNEESGFSDTMKEWKADVHNPLIFYLISMLFTPVLLPIIIGLSITFLPSAVVEGKYPLAYLILLVLPAVGCWFGYKGYMLQKKTMMLLLCLCINALYATFIIYGILRLG